MDTGSNGNTWELTMLGRIGHRIFRSIPQGIGTDITKTCRHSPGDDFGNQRESGAALVLILLAVLALTSLVVLFFALASHDRASTSAYAQGMRADELGAGGLELVINELRQEMISTNRSLVRPAVGSGPAIYLPKEAKDILPERTAPNGETNLIKMSFSGSALNTLPDTAFLASQASSGSPSRNGRTINAERWAKPGLAAFTGSSALPDWIYFNRQGVTVDPSPGDAANEGSAAFVSGRIAFAVYDVGGLIDVNVAGYPVGLSPADAGKKGSPALADLKVIGLSDDAIASILKFRNPLSAASNSGYINFIHSGTLHEAFTKTVPGDNRFLSRQELIRFAKGNGFADHLDLVTIFSREWNAPSHTPSDPSDADHDLLGARHAGTGKLLFSQRFPLSKIALLSQLKSDPGNAALQEAVKDCFGLKYTDGDDDTDNAHRTFTYVGQDSDVRISIKTLDEIGVEAEWRQPDFFETLKSAILAGSLGQTAGQTATVAERDSADFQVMRIGAAIIDQYDTDHIPMRIFFESDGDADIPVWGVENLPYVNKVQCLGERYHAVPDAKFRPGAINPATVDVSGTANAYSFRWAVEMWNPHVAEHPVPVNAVPDATIRIALGPVNQNARVDIHPNLTADADDPNTLTGTPNPVSAADHCVTLNVNSGPPGDSTPAARYNYFGSERQVFLGLINNEPLLAYWIAASNPGNTTVSTYAVGTSSLVLEDTAATGGLYVDLHVKDPDDAFMHHYFRTGRINYGGQLKTVRRFPYYQLAGNNKHFQGVTGYITSDPRTNRMGMFAGNWRISKAHTPFAMVPDMPAELAASLRYAWPIRISTALDASNSVKASEEITPAAGYSSPDVYPGLLYENTEAATRFADPDGVVRAADGGFAPGTGPSVPTYPLMIANVSTGRNYSRPRVLDRPFRSVAEMGYAFRDGAWKSLNFSGTDSADAAILDAFSLNEAPIAEGKVNINSSRTDVLAALLRGSLRVEDQSASGLTDDGAAELASAIADEVFETPLASVSDFVTRISTLDLLKPGALGGAANRAIKTQREAVVRALAGSTQTRTWNVMIDLVAQTGRFARSAASLNDFVVEGERRYWLHLSLDRFTGEIIDEQLETVSE